MKTAHARRSQLVSTYGVGALFPAQSESYMILGIDSWPASCPEITEPRLARVLGVSSFKAPSAGLKQDIPVIRFPETHYCPRCRKLGRLPDFGCPWNDNICSKCKVELVPSRFVTCCPRGHIDDFPYFAWVHPPGYDKAAQHELSLQARGRSSSLSDIVISCSCGTPSTTLEGALSKDALDGLKCLGRRPWLGEDSQESCDETPRGLQRGSSNVWFPVTRSAISIPPWSEGAHRLIDRHWLVLKAIPADAVRQTIEGMGIATRAYSVDDLTNAVLQRRGYETEAPTAGLEELRAEEYAALCAGKAEESSQQDFVCESVEVASSLGELIEQVGKVSRLREVRALQAFTRILPPTSATPTEQLAPLSLGASSWLPALEVIGEGIFIKVDDDALQVWESGPFARRRAEMLQASVLREGANQPLPQHPVVTPRLLMLHSLAHALIDQLSLDAGYPAASLRERIYADAEMAGVLIFTATSDSAGSMGGLAAQSESARLSRAVAEAASRMSWCSSDPVCIESKASGAQGMNLAACHSCLLVPETSCELSNTFIDRATLIGTPEEPLGGFLSPLLAVS